MILILTTNNNKHNNEVGGADGGFAGLLQYYPAAVSRPFAAGSPLVLLVVALLC